VSDKPLRFYDTSEGQPTSNDSIKFHSELLLGSRSVVRLTGKDPPPCVALPKRRIVWLFLYDRHFHTEEFKNCLGEACREIHYHQQLLANYSRYLCQIVQFG
jgi:hypothetical protein